MCTSAERRLPLPGVQLICVEKSGKCVSQLVRLIPRRRRPSVIGNKYVNGCAHTHTHFMNCIVLLHTILRNVLHHNCALHIDGYFYKYFSNNHHKTSAV